MNEQRGRVHARRQALLHIDLVTGGRAQPPLPNFLVATSYAFRNLGFGVLDAAPSLGSSGLSILVLCVAAPPRLSLRRPLHEL